MQAALRQRSEWDEVNLRYGGRTITLVYRRAPGARRFEPWVFVAPSALLRRAGAHGLGLYAARGFKRDDVGQYPHDTVVGRYPTRDAALNAPRARRLLMPLLIVSQAVPVFAIAPLLVLWFGYGMASKVVMATLIIFFPVTAAFLDGLRRTEPVEIGARDVGHVAARDLAAQPLGDRPDLRAGTVGQPGG